MNVVPLALVELHRVIAYKFPETVSKVISKKGYRFRIIQIFFILMIFFHLYVINTYYYVAYI